jgi:hypothetical protein
MTFQEAEYKLRELEKKWSAGLLTVEAYRAILVNLRVVDASGQVWMIQEHTGCWFVLRDGQWIQSPQPSSQQAASPEPVAVKPAAPSKRGQVSLVLILGLVSICLLGTALITTGVLVYTGLIPLPASLANVFHPSSTSSAQSAPQVVVKPAETISAAADGAPHTDSNGVTLVVPAEALAEGGQVSLSANELNAPWRKAIEKGISFETPFYNLTVPGKNDSTGSLSLSFPATNPKARLLAVIDGDFLVELAQAPENGTLTIQTRAAPTDTTGLTPPDGVGSIYYAVIAPKSTSRQSPDIQMVRWHPQADERNCIPDLSIIGGAAINLCRQNPSGTVQVMLPTAQRDLVPQADIMVDKIETVMTKYYNLGFTSAQLTHSSPMLVRVSAKVTSPSYYPLNGVLYIPVDTVTRIASQSPTDLYHEMAHWIQAIKYSTRLAYYSGERTWWLETSAENMVMLIEPDYVGSNLRTYGTISTSDNTLALQATPYQWPGDYYVQAQLVKVNLCDGSACPLSTASFAKAISEGSYPLMNGSAKSQISSNLKDYAFYLLGKPPSAANSAISRTGPVKTGEGYGEYVRITRNNNVDLKYDYNGSDPQMRKESKDGKEALVIEAKIQRDGVYPLMILGGEGKNPGLPVELVIEPGASFYYTVDDGELKYSDGSQELKLLPIHGEMGIKKVRLVAMGINGGEIFKARVQPLSLEGAWVVATSGAKTAGTMTCSGGAGEVDNPDGTAQLMAYVTAIMSGMGDMKADPTGRSLDWSEVAGRVPAQLSEEKVTFKATALLSGDAIQYQASVDVPKADSSSSLPPTVPIAAAVSLPAIWLGRKRLNIRTMRVLVNVFVIAFVVLASTGCFGLGMYGSSTVDAKFQKIEYVGGEDTGVLTVSNEASGLPQGKPLWKLTGSGTYDVSFSFESTTTDANGVETTDTNTCTGAVTFPVTAFVYKDFQVVIPNN